LNQCIRKCANFKFAIIRTKAAKMQIMVTALNVMSFARL